MNKLQIKKDINSHISKIIYEIISLLYFVLYFVCENKIQTVTTLKDYEDQVQFHGSSFFIMNTKIQLRIHC